MIHRRAQRVHARCILANAREHRAKWRINHAPYEEPHNEQDNQAIDIGGLAPQIEFEPSKYGIDLHAGQTIRSPCEPRRLVGDLKFEISNLKRGDNRPEI